MKKNELLKVYHSKDEAYDHLDEYAAELRRAKITSNYGVYAAPVQRSKPLGYWGIYLRDRRVKG